MISCLVFSNFSVSVVSQFVRDMKRSDHVSLCTTTPSSITSSNNSSNNGGKKLRKRRELNAMAAPHVIVRSSQGQSNNSSNRSGNKKSDYKSIYFSNSSSNNNEEDDDDDDQEDFRHHGGEAYMNLMNKRSKKTRQSDWMKRNRKILNFCHRFCFAFVIISGFMVLITLTWLHFSLRSQTQDLNAQLHQVLDEKSELKKIQEELQTKLNSVATNQSILQDNLASIYTKVENLSSQVSVLNGSISTALVNLANAPQLKEVPDKIVKLSQELGQFGSRLTGVESQVTGTKNDLSKVQDSLKKLPKKTSNNPDVATSNAQVDKPALDALTLQFDSKLHNQTARLDEKIDKAAENFNILATNLTEQLQKQEIHAAKSWKLLDELNTNVQNVSAKAASNELISRENQAEIAKLQKSEKLQKSSNNNGGPPSTPKVINNNLN